MTSTYKSYNKFLPSFLSVHIDCLFHFAASMDIDFRRSIDPWCGHDPRYLACDGTHVGIPINNVNIVGIENPGEHRTVQTQHLRYDRCFYRIATITIKSRSGRQEQIYLIYVIFI